MYNPNWHDMSEYVVHFTKEYNGKSSYDNMMGILSRRVLKAFNPFGMVRDRAPNIESQLAVCFSETPLHLLERIARRRGEYGIGFKKEFILSRGGNPIWYVEHGSGTELALQSIIDQAISSPGPENHPIWMLTPLIDAPGIYGDRQYRFEWEREWRHVGDLQFRENDAAFLIIPEELHGAARSFFEDAVRENTGPGYFCPYIDIGWSLERVQSALRRE